MDHTRRYLWFPIPGYRGWYEANALGQIRSVPRTFRDTIGRPRTFPGRPLNPTPTHNGYSCVGLCRGGQERWFLIHVLILRTFRGPCPIGMEGCHANDIGTDNRIANLYWGTPKQNAADRQRNNPKFAEQAATYAQIALTYGVSIETAHSAATGKRYGTATASR